MNPIKSLLFLSALLSSKVLTEHVPSQLPTEAKCWSIPYPPAAIHAAANETLNLPLNSIQGYPRTYPLSNLNFPKWEHNGGPFPKTGAPFAAGCDTSDLMKFPLVPANLNGAGGAWDGTKSRKSSIDQGYTQSDFLFLDGAGRFCLIATETPYGVDGWLPCWWE